MLEKVYSILSGAFFLIMVLPLVLPYSPNGFDMFDFLLSINLYLPTMLGAASIFFGWIGIKGNVRFYLILLNSPGFMFYVFVALTAIFGFKEP